MLKDEYKVYEEKMKKSIESVMSDFDTVRAGRANASVLNRILSLIHISNASHTDFLCQHLDLPVAFRDTFW